VTETWQPFGAFEVPEETWDDVPEEDGVKWLNLSPGKSRDRSAMWLRNAMIALAVLAFAAAIVSFEAQFQMVYAVKNLRLVAALEAGIPDAGALVFASLGIALALHGKRAVRARILNVTCVGISLAMNALAADAGWKNLAIWVMPPAVYALASDTLIGVIRAWALARARELNQALADDETTPLAILAGISLWLLRLLLAPPSTLTGFRTWVTEECPVAPGRRALPPAQAPALPASPPDDATRGLREGNGRRHRPVQVNPEPVPARWDPARTRRRRDSKTSQFLDLVTDRIGPLNMIDPSRVSQICSELAPEVGLNVGAARSALLPLVRAAQNGGTRS
jgi:hypothetical protein